MLLRSAPKSFFVKDLLVQRCVNAIEGLTFSYGTKQTEKTEKLPMETTVIGHSSESKITIKKGQQRRECLFCSKNCASDVGFGQILSRLPKVRKKNRVCLPFGPKVRKSE